MVGLIISDVFFIYLNPQWINYPRVLSILSILNTSMLEHTKMLIPTIDFSSSREAKFLSEADCKLLIETELVVRLAHAAMNGVTHVYVNIPTMDTYPQLMRLFPQLQMNFKVIPIEPWMCLQVNVFTARTPEIIPEFIVVGLIAAIVDNAHLVKECDHLLIETNPYLAIQVLAVVLDMNILPKNITWSW